MQGIRRSQPSARVPLPRVAVLYSQSLLLEGMEAYLRQAGHVEVAGLDVDRPDAWEQLRSLRPNAVLMDVSDVQSAHRAALAEFIRTNPEIRIIDVRPGRSTADVYQKQQIPAAHPADLLKALIGERNERRA